MKRRICFILTTRGNYAKSKSTLRALSKNPNVHLQLVVGGALKDDGYGEFAHSIKADGFKIDAHLHYPTDGGTPKSIAEAAGICTIAMSRIFAELTPDIAMIIADRYEALSIAQAALCMNIRIAHLEGGEVSGSIDERIRHAITKLAHLHFPANADAAQRIVKLGEHRQAVHITGTPSLDLLNGIDMVDLSQLTQVLKLTGQGNEVLLDKPYVVVSQHPVVTEYRDASRQFEQLAAAIKNIGLPTIWVLPNDDAGGSEAKPLVQALIDTQNAPPVRYIGGLVLESYVVLLKNAACLIGNTSSGIRESAFLGIPTVNVGTRQAGRLRGVNVIDVDYNSQQIVEAVKCQIEHGPYPSDPIYGNGKAGEIIANVLATACPKLDKRIEY